MKKIFKRMSAMLLTLCMLATLMVPVSFAAGEAVASASANVAETYSVRIKDLMHIEPSTATGIDRLLVTASSSAATGYKYYYASLTDSKFADAYANGTLNFKAIAASGQYIYRDDQMWQARLAYNAWAALQIRVDNSGMYALNLHTDKTASVEGAPWTNNSTAWSGKVTAYIIPVAVVNDAIANAVATETESAEVVAINGLLNDEYCVGTVSVAADQTDATFAKKRMEAGEYVVVYTAGKSAASAYCVSEMSLLGDAYEMKNVATYALRPFDFTNTDPATYAGTHNSHLVTVSADGAVTWATTLAPKNVLKSTYADLGVQYLSLKGTVDYRNYNLMQLRLKSAGDWVALKINVPETDDMYLTLTTDKRTSITGFTYTNSYATWTGNISAYLIPLSALAATDATTIGAAMTAENCVGIKALSADATTVTFNKKAMDAGEYVLVYTADVGGLSLCEASLDKVAGNELPESEKFSGVVASYDFEIYNNERYAPIFTQADGSVLARGFGNIAFSGLEGVYEAGAIVGDIIANDYANGIINYKLEGQEGMALTDYQAANGRGLRIQKAASEEAAGAYVAFRLNVPTTALYNVNLANCANTIVGLKVYAYAASAAGDIATNMTDANLVATFEKATSYTAFESILYTGENIIVIEFPATKTKDTFNLMGIDLKINDEAVTYNFDLYNNAEYVAALAEKSGGQITALGTASSTNINKYEWTNANNETESISGAALLAELFVAGKNNWALDSFKVDAALKSVNHPSGSLQFRMRNCDDGYMSARIRVENAGTYKITVNASCTTNQYNAYLIPATNNYVSYASCIDVVPYMTDAYLLGTSSTKNAPVTVEYTFDQAGEYVLVIAETGTGNNDSYLRSMVMEPIVSSFYADGVGYDSLEEAVKNASDYVFLGENVEVGELVLPAGVTLDLNGHILYATSVSAIAPNAKIVDTAEGKGLIRGNIEFNENNAQLPLYDIDADGYRLFTVNVESVATTGKHNTSKYWFKINFSNDDVFEMIGLATELRIKALMAGTVAETGEAFEAVASANAEFSLDWAANNTSYIVVSSVGSKGINDFALNPAITANGVVISGDAMHKGA